jgi:short-subunit dehydrogenase involved in D-alanine esterification of teichoic acids
LALATALSIKNTVIIAGRSLKTLEEAQKAVPALNNPQTPDVRQYA